MRRLIALCALLAAIAAPAAAFEPDPDGRFAERVIAITDPTPAPETVIDLTGGALTSVDAQAGKVAIVTLWATWCHVCEVEMPELAALARRYEGRDLVVMPVSVDAAAETNGAAGAETGARVDRASVAKKVARHLASHDLEIFPVMLDRNLALAQRVGLRGTPTTLIVDRFSQVVAAFEGQAPWSDPETDAYLDALLTAPDADASRGLLAGR